MNIKTKGMILIFIFLPILLFASGEKEKKLKNHNFLALGTSCTIVMHEDDNESFFEVEKNINKLEAQISTNIETSEITKINKNAGISPVTVSENTFELILAGIEYSKKTKGVFDITVGPLVQLWNIAEGGPVVPARKKIDEALSLVDYKNIVLSSENSTKTVYLREKNMVLEPGGIAKGFIADIVVKQLKSEKIETALINFGGNVVALGSKPDGTNWRIAIQDPDASRGSYLGIVTVKDKSVVTSGKYERFFIGEDGRRYHHILSTKTGFPVENNISQVSIISDSSTAADALSTSVFCLGIKQGLWLLKSLPSVDAIIITEDKKIILTDGIKSIFKLTNTEFEIIESSALKTISE